MSGEKIRRRLGQKPFVPFRLVIADGSSVTVKQADRVEVVPRRITVTAISGRRKEICPREIVSLDEL